ncbi:MAG TPA: hypothetical protein VI541_02260 [Actinomycetota bacterium]|nr:hypothetical protein [Actinomycetota bacterium]
MAKLQFSPRQVDEMEFWEVAKILGVEETSEDPVYQRLKAYRGKGKMPTARPIDVSTIGR